MISGGKCNFRNANEVKEGGTRKYSHQVEKEQNEITPWLRSRPENESNNQWQCREATHYAIGSCQEPGDREGSLAVSVQKMIFFFSNYSALKIWGKGYEKIFTWRLVNSCTWPWSLSRRPQLAARWWPVHREPRQRRRSPRPWGWTGQCGRLGWKSRSSGSSLDLPWQSQEPWLLWLRGKNRAGRGA